MRATIRVFARRVISAEERLPHENPETRAPLGQGDALIGRRAAESNVELS